MAKSIKSEQKLSPLMEQYWGIKSAHPDKILFFRMGDFFEIFADDAELVAPLLGIALTVRNKKSNDLTKMCGMPHHSIAGAVTKLLACGHKVAICDQLEDPKQSKGLVKRGITRILSPGMVFDPETLEAGSSHYLASYQAGELAFLDSSTGECFYYAAISIKQRQQLLQLLNPAELLLGAVDYEQYLAANKQVGGPHLSLWPEGESLVDLSRFESLRHWQGEFPLALHRLLSYVTNRQGDALTSLLQRPQARQHSSFLQYATASIEHLELFVDSTGQCTHSLMQKISRCKTAIGARKLSQFLRFPLCELRAIEARQERVQYWLDAGGEARRELRKVLAFIGDPERRLAKVLGPAAGPRDLQSLGNSLRYALQLQGFFARKGDYQALQTLVERMDRELMEDAPVALGKGFFLQRGVSQELDEFIEYSENAQQLLRDLESEERQRLQIPSLKIRYNGVFGYYIEITKAHTQKVPEDYERKQTLVNGERFTNARLRDLERKVLSATAQREAYELEVFRGYIREFAQQSETLMDLSQQVAELDVFSALAELAAERDYVRPVLREQGAIHIVDGKHPVLEQQLGSDFVANDMDIAAGACILLTGPNMAGKSTLMRQLALLVILAQIGSFVPAESAELPVFRQIFTRIGASDSLSEGQSTFMVEMRETAEILEAVCDRSLVLMDEVGRGTSTFDGMSLAQAIVEYLLEQRRACVLFSTHYHELTRLQETYPRLENRHMVIRESKDRIHFLHKWQKGAASKSYGIYVAKLAGLPSELTRRAERILRELELQGDGQYSLMAYAQDSLSAEREAGIGSPVNEGAEKLRQQLEEIRNLKIQEMTPIELMTRISQWQNQQF